MELDSPVTELKGVGAELAKKLAILGIHTLGDLVDDFPRRYEDYSHILPANQLTRVWPGDVIRTKTTWFWAVGPPCSETSNGPSPRPRYRPHAWSPSRWCVTPPGRPTGR